MRLWLVVGLLCLCVLVYCSSLFNKGASLDPMVRSRTVGKISPEVMPSAKEDASFPDYDDANLVTVDSVANQVPESVGAYLDPDAGPDKNGTAKSSHQRKVGMFLDIDEKPGDHISLGISPQRNVGTFLRADGIAVDFVVGNESKVVNIGEFINLDGSE